MRSEVAEVEDGGWGAGPARFSPLWRWDGRRRGKEEVSTTRDVAD